MHYIFFLFLPSTDHLLWSSIIYIYVYILFNLANFKFEQHQGKWNEKSSQRTVQKLALYTHTYTVANCTVACHNKSVNLIWKIITNRSVEGKGKNCDKFCAAMPDLRVKRSGGNTTPAINQFTDEEFNRTARARSTQSTSTTIIICPGIEVNQFAS